MDLISRGRKKLFGERITLPLASDMLESIDRDLQPHETRLSYIRTAIERETAARRQQAIVHMEAKVTVLHGCQAVCHLTLMKGGDVIYSEYGHEESDSAAIVRSLDKALTFGVNVLIVHLDGDDGRHVRIYEKIDGRLEHTEDRPCTADFMDAVRKREYIATRGERGQVY